MAKNTSLDSLVKNRKVVIAAGVFMTAMIILMLANALGGGFRNNDKLQITNICHFIFFYLCSCILA